MAKKSYKFSLITIVNNKSVYEDFIKNLSTQKGVDYELIRINNESNQFNAARTAYNNAASKASGEYLIFLHPDIRFLDKDSLHDIVNQCLHQSNLGIAGIAGVPDNVGPYHILTTMKQGTTPHHVGDMIDRPTIVQTVDECFFMMTRKFWKKHPFSDLKGWHLYAVEQCLQAELDGKTNYIVPARIWHVSDGASENKDYVRTGWQIVERYGKFFPVINTTVYKWDTQGIRRYLMPWFHYLDHQVERKLRNSPELHDLAKQIKHIFIKPW